MPQKLCFNEFRGIHSIFQTKDENPVVGVRDPGELHCISCCWEFDLGDAGQFPRGERLMPPRLSLLVIPPTPEVNPEVGVSAVEAESEPSLPLPPPTQAGRYENAVGRCWRHEFCPVSGRKKKLLRKRS